LNKQNTWKDKKFFLGFIRFSSECKLVLFLSIIYTITDSIECSIWWKKCHILFSIRIKSTNLLNKKKNKKNSVFRSIVYHFWVIVYHVCHVMSVYLHQIILYVVGVQWINGKMIIEIDIHAHTKQKTSHVNLTTR
jgi:hypothetical protein